LIPASARRAGAQRLRLLFCTGPSPHYSSPVKRPPRRFGSPCDRLTARTQQYTLGAP
jgi:hypothetical protein